MELFITVGLEQENGGQIYYQMNIAAHTIALVANGQQLDFYRALGIPEHIHQAAQIIEGYREI